MRYDRNDWVLIEEVKLIRSTANAGLYEIGMEEVWIPWSQIREADSVDIDGHTGDLYLRRWIAEEKDLEYEEEE